MNLTYRSHQNALSKVLVAAAVLAGARLVSACGDDDAPPPPPADGGRDLGADLGADGGGPDVDAGPVGMIRIVHASPNTPAIDVYAGTSATPAIDALAYTETSDYLMLPAGTYTFNVRADGAAADSTPALVVADFVLAAGDKYTIVAAGSLTSTDAADRLRVLPLQEEFGALGGNARVRIVHAGFNAPTVAIDVGDDGTSEVASLERFADTGADGVSLPAGAAQVGVLTTGAGATKVSAFTAPIVAAEIFVIATGDVTQNARLDTSFGLLAVGPAGTVGFLKQNPRVYALHGSPDAPAVEIFAGTAELVGGVTYGDIAGPLQVPPGDYTLDFFPVTAGTARPAGAPAGTDDVDGLVAGNTYLAVANGFLAPRAGTTDAPFQVLALVEGFDLADAANVRVRAVHGSPSAPSVTVGAVTGTAITTALASDVAFGASTAAEGASLPATTYTIGFAAGATTTPVLARFTAPLTAAGKRWFAIAHGDFAAVAGREPFGVFAVDTSVTPWTVTDLPSAPAP